MDESDPGFPIGDRLLRARKEASPKMSQKRLGELVGLTQQGIAEIESGRVSRPSKIREIAMAVDRSERWLLGEVPLDPVEYADVQPSKLRPNAGAPTADEPPKNTVPILGFAVGGADGRFLLNGITVGTAFMPPPLNGVPRSYAVYVHGTSMLERFKPGETVWVNPHQPYVAGDDVVVQIRPDRAGEAPFGYVKRYVSMDARRLVLEQLNPPEDEERLLIFPRKFVISVHKIVFSGAS